MPNRPLPTIASSAVMTSIVTLRLCGSIPITTRGTCSSMLVLPCSRQQRWCRAGRAPLRTAGHTPLEPLAALAVTGTTHANCEPHAKSVGSRKENDRPGHLGPSLAGPDPAVNETRSRAEGGYARPDLPLVAKGLVTPHRGRLVRSTQPRASRECATVGLGRIEVGDARLSRGAPGPLRRQRSGNAPTYKCSIFNSGSVRTLRQKQRRLPPRRRVRQALPSSGRRW
ncbi:hypothetical protein [Ornithinimicrobium kibberense]|uniref:hypothetical protein n=1 Tax=Ornithinimicrobium kibberense TaxID=282060 RepID=UPI0036199704